MISQNSLFWTIDKIIGVSTIDDGKRRLVKRSKTTTSPPRDLHLKRSLPHQETRGSNYFWYSSGADLPLLRVIPRIHPARTSPHRTLVPLPDPQSIHYPPNRTLQNWILPVHQPRTLIPWTRRTPDRNRPCQSDRRPTVAAPTVAVNNRVQRRLSTHRLPPNLAYGMLLR